MGTALMSAKSKRMPQKNLQDEEKEELVDAKKLRELAALVNREGERLTRLADKMDELKLHPINAMTGNFHGVALKTLRNFAGRQVIAKLLSEVLDRGIDIDELVQLSPPKTADDS